MKGRGILLGFAIRVACSLALAIFALAGVIIPMPDWATWIVVLLQRPLAAAYYALFPSQDSFAPAILPSLSLGYFISVGFAVSVYLFISYLPNLCLLLWHATRHAMRTPAVFLAYASAGAILGSMAGLLMWSAFTTTGSQVMMLKVAVGCGLSVGWLAAVSRSALERHLERSS